MHIQSDFYFGYKHKSYHDKQEMIDKMFYKYHLYLLKDTETPALIQEWKNIDAADYEKNINK